jgi:hypothetical protein
MRYMLMHKLDENVPGNYDPSPEFQARMGRFMQEAYQAGVVLAAEGLHPTKVDSARITVSGGKTTIKDGPFTETKELIAGFALVEVRSKEEAVEWAKRFADVFIETGSDVEIDIRPICEMPGQSA